MPAECRPDLPPALPCAAPPGRSPSAVSSPWTRLVVVRPRDGSGRRLSGPTTPNPPAPMRISVMNENQLRELVQEAAERLAVPGVAVGVYFQGEEHYAFHGVTSVENPLPVDENTLFQFGSTGKTFTATAIMRLVDQGKVDLHAPVRTYLPDFRLKDETVAKSVTVLQLLNHTAGWAGDLMDDTGDGDDALVKYLEKMADLEQVTPLGSVVSYNNASLSVAGHIIATINGTTYEQAMRELIFEPLGLEHSFFFP